MPTFYWHPIRIVGWLDLLDLLHPPNHRSNYQFVTRIRGAQLSGLNDLERKCFDMMDARTLQKYRFSSTITHIDACIVVNMYVCI